MSTSLELLYNEFRNNFEDNPDYVITFFNNNLDLFENIDSLEDTKELRFCIEMIWQYLNGLYLKNRYNETIDAANKFIQIIENKLKRFNEKDLRDDWFYGLYQFKGMSAYNLRDYKTAAIVFKQLRSIDPKNENYKNWLHYSNYGSQKRVINLLYIVLVIILLVELFFKNHILNANYRIAIKVIGLFGLALIWSYEYYIRRNIRKTTNRKI